MFKTFMEYRSMWDKAYVHDPPIPLNVDIELASVCNLSCPFCFISDPSYEHFIYSNLNSRRRLMSKNMAIKLIDEAHELGVPSLKFNWRGESTLHPDFSAILHYARTTPRFRFYELLVNTNANCMFPAVDGLMAATKVMISLDSLNPETYKIMRRRGNLELAMNVISELVRRKHPNIWIRRVLTKENDKEEFFNQVRSHWGDKVHVSEHFCFDRNKAAIHQIPGCDHDNIERRYCGYPSQRLVIASTGLVYPCCIDLHEEMPVGDIRISSLSDIWNGERLRKLRERLRHNVFKSKICQNCESWMAYAAKERDFVTDVELS